MTGSATGAEVVLGVDIGTSSTKVVAYDLAGSTYGSGQRGYSLDDSEPGWAVQDPAVIVEAVLASLTDCVAAVRERRATVLGLSLSSAMHSLIGLDGAGRPLTPSVTWADQRAGAQARRLRAGADGLALHRRSGTPVHPMSPLVKLCWYAEEDPDTFGAVRTWLGIKEYVLVALTGERVCDLSIASGTGLLDLGTRDWSPDALAVAGIAATQLPPVVATRTVLPGLLADVAARIGLPMDTRTVVGAGDGPLANLGVGAIEPGVAAVSLGTSGALRVTQNEASVDPGGELFCYALDDDLWVAGGALNNGGIVVRWAEDVFAADRAWDTEDRGEQDEWLLGLAADVPAGSAGLVMLPYLLGERAPRWDPLPRGAFLNVRRVHTRAHFVRAAVEGVCLQLALVAAAVERAGYRLIGVRATGGAFRAPLWSQTLAGTLGCAVGLTAGPEGSSYGAAVLGFAALGRLDSLTQAADLVSVEREIDPEADDVAVYAELLPVFAAATEALLPTFDALRQLETDSATG